MFVCSIVCECACVCVYWGGGNMGIRRERKEGGGVCVLESECVLYV